MRGGLNMHEMMRQAQALQKKIAQAQEDLAQKSFTANAGGGMVTATVNGRQEVLSVRIEKQVIDPDEAEMLQDLIVAAVNSALNTAKDTANQEMAKLTGGLGIPGLM
ncbi:MAG: YbaB/EbfC family nucleoid-associated protein [Deltaproteobacteria bacterium]|nr:YbaB/EbfC family nucleoid-associated protein [Deltaproteobacteria bacterium]